MRCFSLTVAVLSVAGVMSTAEAGKCGKGGFLKGRKARKAVCYVAPTYSYGAYPNYSVYPSYAPTPQAAPYYSSPQTPTKVLPQPENDVPLPTPVENNKLKDFLEKKPVSPQPEVIPVPTNTVVDPIPDNGPPIFTDPTPQS